jgi:ACS family tartrate transporter-like MFS transporter
MASRPPERPTATPAETEHRAFAKAARRLLPVLTVAYVLNYLDRSNIGFAGLTMNRDLGLSATQFGNGAGILFLGYCAFEIPGNLLLYRIGARRWLARIMISWGLVSSALIFAHGAGSFYLLRFLLGVAEAGFFPGVTFYLAAWFPAEQRARILAWFLLAIPVSSVIGGPLSGLLLTLDGALGLAGWKWLFLVEGLPSVLIGLLLLRLLADRPEEARWLAPDEQHAIAARLTADSRRADMHRLLPALTDRRVLLCAGIMLGFTIGSYGIGIWLPLILKQARLGTLAIGWLVALPYACASIGMVVWSRLADRSGRRVAHLALACFVAAAGLIIALATGSLWVALPGLSLALVGVTAARAIFWAVPTGFLGGIAAAGGLAFINTIGTLGGYVGPFVVGWLRDRTGAFTAGLSAMAAFLLIGAGLALVLKRALPAA